MALEKIVFVFGDKLPAIYNLLFQTDDCNVDKPKIRSNQDCSDKIKAIQQSVACQLKWPKLLSKHYAVPFMVMIFIFVLMASQKWMEMHHNHQQKDESIHIQKRSMPSVKAFCHNWEQLLILSTCKHLRWKWWPCWVKREMWKSPFIRNSIGEV